MAQAGFEPWPHPILHKSWGCRVCNAQEDGGPVGQENQKDHLSTLQDFPTRKPFPMPALHMPFPSADPPPFCTSRCLSLPGPSCPGLTAQALSKAQSQAAPLLRGASVQQRSKSRLAYQTRSSLNFYRPDSIINELSVPHRRARSWSWESEALRAGRVFSRKVHAERGPLGSNCPGSSPSFATY